MTFSIMISTRNRVRDLQQTCGQLLRLNPRPHEVLICADGCQDDTLKMLCEHFPQFRILHNARQRGSIYSRDRMLRVAHGDIVVSLDDDSYPAHPEFLQDLEIVFRQHPEAGIVVFPEQRPDGLFSAPDKTPLSPGHYVSAYANCAAAMRRGVYGSLPGFVDFFEHAYEEPDYALQCYSAGTAVWFEPSLIIEHRESPINRNLLHRHHLTARNELWSVWLRCPWPWLPVVSVYRILRQLAYAATQGFAWVLREPAWWADSFKELGKCRYHRRPVPWSIYYAWMRLARRPIFCRAELSKLFPAQTRPKPGA